jgi:hypothetical protein
MSTSPSAVETSLVHAGLLVTGAAAAILTNNIFSAVISSSLGPYGHWVLAMLAIVASLGAFFKALQSTPLSIPSNATKTIVVDPGLSVDKTAPLSMPEQPTLSQPVAAGPNGTASVLKVPAYVNPVQAELDKEFPKSVEPSLAGLNSVLGQVVAASDLAQPTAKTVSVFIRPTAK